MKHEPSYYANIPATVRYDKSLPANAKLLYGEITALCNKEGFCWASNQYFAELYGASPRTVREWVSKLAQQGYIRVEIIDKVKRKIFLGVGENPPGGRRKSAGEVGEKLPHNNTANNTSNTTSNTEHSSADIVTVIDAFKEWNPAAKTWYARQPYRQAIDRLLTLCPRDQLCRIIAALPESNKQKYFPMITTPHQLEDKWSQLQAAYTRFKQEQNLTEIL